MVLLGEGVVWMVGFIGVNNGFFFFIMCCFCLLGDFGVGVMGVKGFLVNMWVGWGVLFFYGKIDLGWLCLFGIEYYMLLGGLG